MINRKEIFFVLTRKPVRAVAADPSAVARRGVPESERNGWQVPVRVSYKCPIRKRYFPTENTYWKSRIRRRVRLLKNHDDEAHPTHHPVLLSRPVYSRLGKLKRSTVIDGARSSKISIKKKKQWLYLVYARPERRKLFILHRIDGARVFRSENLTTDEIVINDN